MEYFKGWTLNFSYVQKVLVKSLHRMEILKWVQGSGVVLLTCYFPIS